MKIDIEQLCIEVQEFLDTDPRFFDQDEGAFEWHYHMVLFTKTDDFFVLELFDCEVIVPRP